MSSAKYEVHGSTAVITLDNPPVNGLGYDLRVGIVAGIDKASADPAVTAVVMIGNERAFSGGADIREFGLPKAYALPNLPAVIQIVENCPKPVVAAISGVCMGGGFELTLGAHFRIAKPDAKIALPEVKLGLIPGAGGTQRGPRILGVEGALNLMVKGDPVPASAFKGTPLIDEFVEGDLLPAALAFADKVVAEQRPIRRISEMKVDYPNHEAYLQFARNMIKGVAGPFPAPAKCADAIAASLTKSFAEGMKVERELFIGLMGTPESRALRHLFAAERAASKIPDIPDDTPVRTIAKVGVIGAGTMGGGISMNFLNAGIPVTMLEMKQEALDKGVAIIRKNYENSMKKGKLTQEKLDQRMGLLGTTLSYDDFKDCDLIIEAVFEDIGVKEAVFRKLDEIAKPGAILASNTSTLDVNKIANFTQRPQDVVGMHFFSPANVMKLLEVVRGAATAKDVMATVMQVAKKIRKTAVVSGVCDGFIGNRMIEHYGRVAGFLLEEGATPAQVDKALEKWGMAMGPFRMGDLAGNDIGWAIRKRRYVEKPNIKYAKFADKLCEQGRYGQKTGKGWYLYKAGERKAIPDPEVDAMLVEYRKELGITPRKISDAEIVERCIYALVNEGARIVEEGIAARASDIDMIYLTGYGFPMFRGGPMLYADEMGLYNVARRMQAFAASSGDAFWEPAPLIAKRVAEGRSLT
ncbi:MAG: enoyl-CoA hydratase/isomerase family protein [Rhodocyclales bacterium]|nr:enoyl-CoA hydratase/isomerase family protein [Rhodocyclales bacterium]